MGARIRPGGSAVNRHQTGTRDRESCREISLAQHGGPDGRRWGAPEIRFALDSPLEGDGFEPSVPVAKKSDFVAEGELRGWKGGSPKRGISSTGYRWFESISLQRGVCCELGRLIRLYWTLFVVPILGEGEEYGDLPRPVLESALYTV
jgi:hypothetical protein